MLSNVSVIIRASGERTENLCRTLLGEIIPTEHIVTIHEAPFSRAVETTCEIGIEYGLPWTLAVDADVLVAPSTIPQMIDYAEQQDENIFFLNPYVIDKIFYSKRFAGIHLYRTSLLAKGKKLISHNNISMRPETYMVREMYKLGNPNVTIPITVALHDFEQYYRDIFRTVITHTVKHRFHLQFLYPIWSELTKQDDDYKFALWAYETSKLFPVKAKLDSRDYVDDFDQLLLFLGLTEKKDKIIGLTGDTIDDLIEQLASDKLLLSLTQKFQSLQQTNQRHPRYWLFKLGRKFSAIGNVIQRVSISM